MKNNDGSLGFRVDLDNDQFRQKIKETENSIRGLADNSIQQTSKMDSAFRNLSAIAGGVFAFAGAQQFISDVVRVRGEFQGLEIAFKTMLGSKEKADRLMAEAIDLAAKTPFTLQDVASGAKQLLAYGTGAEQVGKEIKMMGDVASGVGAPLNDLIYLYGTLRAQGRATTIDIRQFAGRGIPIYEELSKVVGVNTKELKTWIESGKIGFAEVEKAFQNMTSEGGMFFNLMEEQSKSVTGRISNLQDAWSRMLNEIGQSNEGVIYSAISGLGSLVENYKQIGSILTGLVVTYGSYKAATIAIVAIEKTRQAMLLQTALAGRALSTWEALHAVLLRRLSQAQALLNKTMLANPYVAVGAAIAGIVTYLVLAREKTDDLTEAQKSFKSEAEDMAAKSKVLFDNLKKTTEGTDARKKAIESINAEYGQYLENLLTEKSTLQEIEKAERLANYAMVDRLMNEKKTEDLVEIAKKQRDILIQVAKAGVDSKEFLDYVTQKDITQFDRKTGKIIGGTFKSWGNEIDALVANYSELIRTQSEVNTKYNDLTKAILGTPINIGTQPEKAFKSVADRVAEINDEISNLEKKRDALPEFDSTGVTSYQNKIEALKNKLAILKGETKGQISPMGSLAYWEDVKQKAEAALKSLAPDDKDLKSKTERYVGEIQKAQENIDRLEFNLKPFDEQLEYRRLQYANYFRWVKAYGEEISRSQFGDLLTQGQNFAEYLEKQRKSLEQIENKTPEQREQLLRVNIEIQKIQSPEAQLEEFKTKLENTRTEAGNLTDYLAELSKQQSALLSDFSPAALAKQTEVEDQIKNTRETLSRQYDTMLSQLEQFYQEYEKIKRGSSQQLAAIAQRVDSGEITPEQGQVELQIVYSGEQEALNKLQADINARIQAFEQFTGSLSDIGRQQLDGFVSQVNSLIDIPELDKIRESVLQQIREAREAQNTDTAEGAQRYREVVQAMSTDLINAGGQAAELGEKIRAALQSLSEIQGTQTVKIDLNTNTQEALLQLDQVSSALQNITGVEIAISAGDSTTAVEQVQAKINAIKEALSQQFGIQIQEDSLDITSQIEAIKAAISEQLSVNIDQNATQQDLQTLLINAQKILKTGVVLPVTVEDTVSLDELLSRYQGYTEKRKAIEKSYNNDISVLSKELNKTTDADRRSKILNSLQERQLVYETEKQQLSESSNDFQAYYSQIEKFGRKALLTQIKNLEAQGDAIKQRYGEDSKEYQNFIDSFSDGISTAKTAVLVSDIDKIAFGLQQASEIAKAMGGDFGETASMFADMAIQALNFTTSLASGDYMGAISSFVGMVASAISDMGTDYDALEKRAIKIQQGELELNLLYRERLQTQAEITKLQWEQVDAIKAATIASLESNKSDIEDLLNQSKESLLQVFNKPFIDPAFLEIYLKNIALYTAKLNEAGQSLNGEASLQKMDMEAYFNMLQELSVKGLLSESDESFYQMLKKLKEEGIDLNDTLDDTIQKQKELMAGTMASTIAQQIAEGFASGKRSAEDFTDTFEDLLKQAFISQLQFRVIEPLIQDFFESLASSNFILGNGRPGANGYNAAIVNNEGLSPNELLQSGFNNAISIASEYIKGFEQATGLNFGGADVTTMQGAIKGITEESASIIAGQFNAMRIIQFDMLAVARNSLLELFKIEVNTRLSANYLKNIDRKLRGTSDNGRQYGDQP